jgi:hypothetical protein
MRKLCAVVFSRGFVVLLNQFCLVSAVLREYLCTQDGRANPGEGTPNPKRLKRLRKAGPEKSKQVRLENVDHAPQSWLIEAVTLHEVYLSAGELSYILQTL